MRSIVMIILCLPGMLWCAETSIDLDAVELPDRVVKILEKHASLQQEAAQDYREAVEDNKADTIKRLEREWKRADGDVALAIQTRIEAISAEGAVDIFGNPIEPPAPPVPPLLQRVLAGATFHHPTAPGMHYTISGNTITHSNGSIGAVTVADNVVTIVWSGNRVASMRVDENGALEYTRVNGQVVEMVLADQE